MDDCETETFRCNKWVMDIKHSRSWLLKPVQNQRCIGFHINKTHTYKRTHTQKQFPVTARENVARQKLKERRELDSAFSSTLILIHTHTHCIMHVRQALHHCIMEGQLCPAIFTTLQNWQPHQFYATVGQRCDGEHTYKLSPELSFIRLLRLMFTTQSNSMNACLLRDDAFWAMPVSPRYLFTLSVFIHSAFTYVFCFLFLFFRLVLFTPRKTQSKWKG